MCSLQSTVREALAKGRQPKDVIDVLLEHGVSTDEIVDVWPESVSCPLYESKHSPTPEDLQKTFDERPSFDDVPPLGTTTVKQENTNLLQRVRNLLNISG